MTATRPDPFEIDDTLTVRYSYGYGGITPFFRAIAERSDTLRITRCAACALDFCPPRIHCQRCWGETAWTDHPGDGAVESVVWTYWVPLDSPARHWTDLPYAYGAVRLDGCHNLLRVRIVGLDPLAAAAETAGLRGRVRVVPEADGRLGDLYFDVPARLE